MKCGPGGKRNSIGVNATGGCAASGPAITSTVNSRPSMYSSTSSRPNSGSLAATCCSSSSGVATRECSSMPMLSPYAAGLTKSGKPQAVGATARPFSPEPTSCQAGTPTPDDSATSFIRSLGGS